MRGRIRIKTDVSSYFKQTILEPGIHQEYEHGFTEMVLLNQAFAIMLKEQGLLSEEESRSILEGLAYVNDMFSTEDIDGKYEELYFNMEHMFMDRVGVAVGGKLHTGRSRNDIYATLWRMEARKSVWEMMASVIALQEVMIKLAAENEHIVFTGYTHMQPAQPITVGYYYSAAIDVLQRDFDRLRDAYQRLNLSPYGAAALAGTGFPIERARLAELLGFDGLVENGLDCVGSRDYLLEIEAALSIMSVNLSRMLQDHYIWCTNEFAVLEIGGEVAVCSSIMPQKKNPVGLELARAKASHVIGSLMSGIGVLKNTPFSLCMDLFETHALYWQGHAAAKNSLDLFAETLRGVKFNQKVAYERAKGNFSTVTALADFLVDKFSLSFAQAHDIVGFMVGSVVDGGKSIAGMNKELLEEASKAVIGKALLVDTAEIAQILEPLANVRAKTSVGSPGAESVRRMLAKAERAIEANKVYLAERQARVEQAYQRLQALTK